MRNVKYAIMLSDKPLIRPSGMLRMVFASYLHWRETGEILGPKTKPFAAALKGDIMAIPIDVWMTRALAIPQLSLRRKAVFTLATSRIADCADYLGWWNCEAQAAIWATAVRSAGRNIPVVSAHTLALEYTQCVPSATRFTTNQLRFSSFSRRPVSPGVR